MGWLRGSARRVNVADELQRRVHLVGFHSGPNRVADVVETCGDQSSLDRSRLLQADGRDFQAALELVARGAMSVVVLPVTRDEDRYRLNPRGGGTTFFSFAGTHSWTRRDRLDIRHRSGLLRDMAEQMGDLSALSQFIQVAATREAYDLGTEPVGWGISARRTPVAVEYFVHAFAPTAEVPPEVVGEVFACLFRRFLPHDAVALREARSVVRGKRFPVEVAWSTEAQWVAPTEEHLLGGPLLSTARQRYFPASPGWRVLAGGALGRTSRTAPNDAGIVVTLNADILCETLNEARARRAAE